MDTLVSILRDTLGDADPENDRLRYLWPLTYTRPGLAQHIAGEKPFFYTRAGNKPNGSHKTPPAVMDLAAPEKQVWEKIFWTALQTVLLDSYGMPIKASSYSTDAIFPNIAARTWCALFLSWRFIKPLEAIPLSPMRRWPKFSRACC